MDIQIVSVPSVTGKHEHRFPETCYLLHHKTQAVLIDPGEDSAAILRAIGDSQSMLIAILATHAHYDHIASVCEIQRTLGAEFWLHSADKPLLRQADLFRLAFGGGGHIEVPTVSKHLDGVELLELGALEIRVIHTPGHTPGSVAFFCSGHLFSGDTLFANSTGGTYLPGGDSNALRASLQTLASLPPDTMLNPGHGRSSVLCNALRSRKVCEVIEGRTDPGLVGLGL